MPYVYILKCKDGTYYTGYTLDIDRRVKEHNLGRASKYTRGRLPVECVYLEHLATISAALQREITIKRLNRASKQDLINSIENTSKQKT